MSNPLLMEIRDADPPRGKRRKSISKHLTIDFWTIHCARCTSASNIFLTSPNDSRPLTYRILN